jgi:hypothetical protein
VTRGVRRAMQSPCPPGFHSQATVQGKDVMQFGSDVDPWATDSVCGQPTYVRYDPAHPEHCEIDHERIVEEYGERETTKFAESPVIAGHSCKRRDAGGGTRTPDTRIMIPLL